MASDKKRTVSDAMVDYRRRAVAAARLRGLTVRQIQRLLAEQGQTNPRTAEPWTISTVGQDVKFLETRWREDAVSDMGLHKGRVLAELAEVRRVAWRSADLDKVLKALTQVRALMGLDQPVKVAPTSPEGDREYRPGEPEFTDEQRMERLAELLERGRAGGSGPDSGDGGL